MDFGTVFLVDLLELISGPHRFNGFLTESLQALDHSGKKYSFACASTDLNLQPNPTLDFIHLIIGNNNRWCIGC